MRRTCYFANHNFKCMHETCHCSLNFDGSPYYSCVRRVYSLWVSYFIWGGFANVLLVKGNSFLQISVFLETLPVYVFKICFPHIRLPMLELIKLY